MEEITNLDFTPHLKKLLIEYCFMHYQEQAIIDNHHLLMELNRLVRENKLLELLELEHFQNRVKYEYESRPNCG
jgi:hypothetical protein